MSALERKITKAREQVAALEVQMAADPTDMEKLADLHEQTVSLHRQIDQWEEAWMELAEKLEA